MKLSNDLTVIFLTVNKVPEKWRRYHRKVLLKAIRGHELITVSKNPMPDMPGINLIQEDPISASNVYRQMLRAAKVATTPYIAMAEDDSLYHKDHFNSFRPDLNTFAYNMTRWSMYEWREPMYSWRDRISNLTLIAPRELLIQCLEERFEKYPDSPDHMTGEVGKVRVENKLNLPHYNTVMWNSDIAVININHQYSMDDRELRQVKKPGSLRAYNIPYWGDAKTLMSHFK
jgi:hypothetical protein